MGKRGRNDDDELEDEGLEDELDEEQEEKGKKKRGKKASLVDDAAEEDDDDDEDGGGRNRRARNLFIDDIADVDEDDEEEEDDEEAEDLIDDRDVDIQEANAAAGHYASYRQLNREREEKSAEDIAKEYEERMQKRQYEFEDAAALAQTGAVGQQAMQPTPNDPKLWLLHCRPGHEREAATQLLQKYYSMHRNGTPLLIKSAVALDHLKGYIYVEAEKEAHVKDAIKGLRTVFVSKGVKLVPINQMVDAITVNRKAKAAINRETWVRVRTGVYKDDLAKVVEVDYAAQKATVRLVPRVDLQAMVDRAQDEEARKRNPFNRGPIRPPARPFNVEEARQMGLVVSRIPGLDGEYYFQIGSQKFVNNYLERDIAFKSLNIIEGMPPLEELQRYNACGAAGDETARNAIGGAGDLSSLVAALPSGGAIPKTHFVKGDLVAIVKGELKGIQALVDTVRDDGKVMVFPKVEGFNEAVDFDNEDLRKMFEIGDRVRVMGGPYTGETGIVLSVVPDSDQCIIISDTTKQELQIFGRDMTSTDVTTTSVEFLGEYQLHDLVQLDQNTAGVILSIQREAARVLTTASSPQQPDIRVVKAADIQRKLKTRAIVTSDALQNQVRAGDHVSFQLTGTGRATQTKAGLVEYVWRGMLFVKCKDFTETGGFTCIRANRSKVRGGAETGVSLARQIANGRSTPTASPGGRGGGFAYMPASPSHYAGGGGGANNNQGPAPGGGGGGFRPPVNRNSGSFSGASNGAVSQFNLVGKAVTVTGGQYRGYKGRVKHETATHVQLEMDAISGRIVTIKKELVGGAAGGRGPGPAGGRGPGGPGQRIPHPSVQDRGGYDGGNAYGSRTPLHPSQTPLHPSMTPAHYSMTPSHAPYTPAHAPTPSDDNYYMLGGHQEERMPPNARTPGMGNAYTPNAFTPAAATPGMYDGPQHAPTPGLGAPAVDDDDEGPPLADTPGMAPTPSLPGGTAPTPYLPAPTPAITPGGDLTAPTPGMDPMMGTTPSLAATPHAGNAFTPNVAATPTLPAATPGLDTHAVVEEPRNYQLWEGIVVQVPMDTSGVNFRQAVVKGAAPDGSLRLVFGKFPDAGGSFDEDYSAREQMVPGHMVRLVRAVKRDRVKVLHAEHHASHHVGHTGIVIGVDHETDCIIKMDSGDMCIVDVTHMAKLAIQG